MKTNTLMKNKEKPSRPTSSKASTKSTPYHSSKISSRSLNDTAEKHSAQTAISWDTGRKTVVSTNVHIATSINLTTKNTYVFFDPSDPTVNPKPLSNKNHHHHHPSLSESPIKEDSKQENPHHPLPPQPPRRPLMKESKRTKEKGRRRIIIPANKERPKEESIEPSTTSKENGIEGWKNSLNNRTNPTTTMMKPSTTSTKNHLDSRSSWKFRTIDGG